MGLLKGDARSLDYSLIGACPGGADISDPIDSAAVPGQPPQVTVEDHSHVEDLQNWINVRDPLYFLRYGILYVYVKRILSS